MARPQRTRESAGYPTLDEHASGRRSFLRRLVLGAVGVGVGSRLLAACESTTDIEGRTTLPELHTVRLPGEGMASAYLDWDEYLRFAVTFTTYGADLAAFYRSNNDEGLMVLSSLLSSYHCEDLRGSMTAIRDRLAAGLEEHYRTLHGETGEAIHSLEILVESCEYMPIAGDMEMPGYP